MEQFLGGLQILLNWQNFLIIPVGLVIGIVVGAIPGLTSDLGIILCIPLTYGMDPTMMALSFLCIRFISLRQNYFCLTDCLPCCKIPPQPHPARSLFSER